MSSCNFPFNYGYYYPQNYYNKNCNSPCQPAACQPASCLPYQPCQPCNPCPTISYITTIPTANTIPNGPAAPAGTVTPIIGYSPIPSTNIGNIVLNGTNGQFTVPICGRYIITAMIGFVETSITIVGGTRQLYIYKVDGTTGSLTLLAEDSRNAVITGNTYVSIATTADLNPGDRIFLAATQNNTGTGTPSVTTTTDGRFTISRLC